MTKHLQTQHASPARKNPDSLAAQQQFLAGPPKGGLLKMLAITWQFMFNKPAHTVPAEAVPVQPLSREALLTAPDNTVYRLGHSTVLLKLNNDFWLTDPVFAERASPFAWIGPKRFHAPPISIEQLPPLKAVILSHDHYDHLDRQAIMRLADKSEYFMTPIGVGARLVHWGVDPAKVREHDWWQETVIDGVRLIATPAQHFSGRGLFDRNRTLWASWAIISDQVRVFFSGDTGYFDGFSQIGARLGPFDLTLMETGAYDVNWPMVHMQPEQTLQAHIDLKGLRLLPIHNGTFDLAMHAWHEPFERIHALALARGLPLATPRMGEALPILQEPATQPWWRAVRTDGEYRLSTETQRPRVSTQN